MITTGSLAEAWGWLDVDRPAAPLWRYRSRWLAYGASKQANALFTVEAGRRWAADGIVATCFFPGLVQTRFGAQQPAVHAGPPAAVVVRAAGAVAADTLVWLATADEALVPGGYFAFRTPFVATPRATDPDRAARLWRASLVAVGLPPDDTTAGRCCLTRGSRPRLSRSCGGLEAAGTSGHAADRAAYAIEVPPAAFQRHRQPDQHSPPVASGIHRGSRSHTSASSCRATATTTAPPSTTGACRRHRAGQHDEIAPAPSSSRRTDGGLGERRRGRGRAGTPRPAPGRR